MINLVFKDPPVRPAVEGTFEMPSPMRGMYFTIGRDYVEEKLKELVRRNDKLGCDIETFGLKNDRFRIKTITLADDRDAVILDPRDEYQADLAKFAFNEVKNIIFHNGQYDVPSLYQRGWITKTQIRKVLDTIITSRQAHPGEFNKHDLSSLAKKYFGIDAEKKVSSDDYYRIDIFMIGFIHGAALDALCTFKLFPVLLKEVQKRMDIPPVVPGLELPPEMKDYMVHREQRISRVLLERMSEGLNVDIDEVDKYEALVKPTQNRAEIIMKQYGMSIQPRTGSYTNANEIIRIISREGAFPPAYPRTKTGKISTKEENLEFVKHPLANAFVANKKIMKVKQYLNEVADEAYITGKIFPTTKILGAGTGRIAMSNPPLHQFTPASRSVIVAEEGDEFSSIDWSQIEPTILVYCADDQIALNRYEGGEADFYEIVGDIVGIERKKAKTVLLAQMYGQGIGSLSFRLGVSDDTARGYRDRIFAAMPSVAEFLNGMKEVGKKRYVHTLFGRVLEVPRYLNDDGKWDIKAYSAVNYFIQGSAYDLLAEAIIKIDEVGLSDKLYFTYHDELIISNSVAEDIAQIMRTPPERFTNLIGKPPVLRCDPGFLGRHWGKI